MSCVWLYTGCVCPCEGGDAAAAAGGVFGCRSRCGAVAAPVRAPPSGRRAATAGWRGGPCRCRRPPPTGRPVAAAVTDACQRAAARPLSGGGARRREPRRRRCVSTGTLRQDGRDKKMNVTVPDTKRCDRRWSHIPSRNGDPPPCPAFAVECAGRVTQCPYSPAAAARAAAAARRVVLAAFSPPPLAPRPLPPWPADGPLPESAALSPPATPRDDVDQRPRLDPPPPTWKTFPRRRLAAMAMKKMATAPPTKTTQPTTPPNRWASRRRACAYVGGANGRAVPTGT